MSEVPSNLKYTNEHEWAKIENDIVTVGITDFAQASLGDIVFVELPEVGSNLTKMNSFGVIESIKSVSDLYSPLTGEVVEANESLVDQPELLNSSPYDSWIVKIKVSNPDELNDLLEPKAYEEICDNS
jgi:glycine cleavage system H protein